MRAIDATLLCLLASATAGAGLACKPAPRASPPPGDASILLTVYVPPKSVERVMGRLQAVAAGHQWRLSIRTDRAARVDADLTIVDSAGTPVTRVRAGSAAAAQAEQMAEALRP